MNKLLIQEMLFTGIHLMYLTVHNAGGKVSSVEHSKNHSPLSEVLYFL